MLYHPISVIILTLLYQHYYNKQTQLLKKQLMRLQKSIEANNKLTMKSTLVKQNKSDQLHSLFDQFKRSIEVIDDDTHKQRYDRSSYYYNTMETSKMSSSLPTRQMKQKMNKSLRSKWNVFKQWDPYQQNKQFNQEIRTISRNSKTCRKIKRSGTEKTLNALETFLKYALELEKKKRRDEKIEKMSKNKSIHNSSKVHQEMENVLADRRERLKKIQNPLVIVHYYKHDHHYKPTQSQDHLIMKLIQLKLCLQKVFKSQLNTTNTSISSLSPQNLSPMLEDIYKLMNMAVDYNQMRLLIILILLAADVSLHTLDYKRAFYFYHQATIAGQFSKMLQYKIQGLIGMSKITYQLEDITHSALFLKKALSYAWFINDHQKQIAIYQLLGQAYFLNGSVSLAKYYHSRFSQGEVEKNTSAVKLICVEIINDSRKNKNYNLYSENINGLFIETLSLPIGNFDKFPRSQPNQNQNHTFDNYVDGNSPRKNREDSDKFEQENFPTIQEQIEKYVKTGSEFQDQMPEPNTQQVFVPNRRYGKNRRQIQFQRSVQYHRITDSQCLDKHKLKNHSDKGQFDKKLPLDMKVQKIMKEKPNDHLFQDMVNNIKMKRLSLVGDLKDKICKSHLKIREKKRAVSTQSDRVKFTINKALIDWIDPVK